MLEPEPDDLTHGRRTIALATHNVELGGRPFAAIITRGSTIVAEAVNSALREHDPTAHAEIHAIRAAAGRLGTEQLTGCTLYSSCEPCVMCAAAILWSSLERVYFCVRREEAEHFGFRDVAPVLVGRSLLAELPTTHLSCLAADAVTPFVDWTSSEGASNDKGVASSNDDA